MNSNKNKNIHFNVNEIKDEVILSNLKSIKEESKKDIQKFILPNNQNNNQKTIEIKNLNKSFSHKHVLKNINLTLYKNEHIALLGGNGAGKTTLVEIIAGLNKQDSGTIDYWLNQKHDFREKIGIQFQDSTYPKGVSVKSVIKFVKDIYKADISKNDLNALIHIFGIDEFYNLKASSLSGGQSQRLNCLLSIIHKPSFLILDELSTGLDVTIKTKIKNFIKTFADKNNISILVISHDMEEVEFLAERIVLLRNGEIYVDAPISEIKGKYKSIQNFIDLYV